MKVSRPILCANEFIKCKGKGSIFFGIYKNSQICEIEKIRNNTQKGNHMIQEIM